MSAAPRAVACVSAEAITGRSSTSAKICISAGWAQQAAAAGDDLGRGAVTWGAITWGAITWGAITWGAITWDSPYGDGPYDPPGDERQAVGQRFQHGARDVNWPGAAREADERGPRVPRVTGTALPGEEGQGGQAVADRLQRRHRA